MKRDRNRFDAMFDFAVMFLAFYISGAILLACI